MIRLALQQELYLFAHDDGGTPLINLPAIADNHYPAVRATLAAVEVLIGDSAVAVYR